MGIEAKFGNGTVVNRVALFQMRVEQAFVMLLKMLGEELVKYAKEQHNYTDRTGNLTNSIGYAIVKRRNILYYGGSDQPGEGVDAMLKTAVEFAAGLSADYSLIVVAGMNYAAYVEAVGYNVILPAELRAKSRVPAELSKLVKKVNSKAKDYFNYL